MLKEPLGFIRLLEWRVSSGFSLDLGMLKEPLGFIRLLEWIFTIFAFGTVGSYSGSTSLSLNCDSVIIGNISMKFSYPFRLYDEPVSFQDCEGNITLMYLQGNFSSSAEFYMCIAVLAFLFCTGTLILYMGYRTMYRQTSRMPLMDLLLTTTFAFLWLVSSSAWAKALTNIKRVTNPTTLAEHCRRLTCEPGAGPTMGLLNASVIFGFLNLILWAGNCWFIYKETQFHKEHSPPMEGDGPPMA